MMWDGWETGQMSPMATTIRVAEVMILSRVLQLIDMRRGLEQEYPTTAEEVLVAKV